ncbi:universal stress protein [Stackebrandtia nassauensis]|uniref:UspA domain protein n=1 Tax=Stackebrandtia nassauensis (strain DSM 44728 / CIP 108903 / NRRL B-16338 / NBRC 102104 / LLR-40K-21) TaxID=446470 RepID=D3PVJ7_STANL|nr:universal stress protein [Stackebrandtia nassauensis]ADD43111.1 UspA domain protein [Stackebrandtia nassauensis DSM 44728]
MSTPVAVGYDDSEHSERAVAWALDEARLRGLPLLLVTVHLTMGAPPPPAEGETDPSAERKSVQDMLDAAKRRLELTAPDVSIETALISASTSSGGLVSESHKWALLVLGDRGRGGFAGILLGSTTTQVSAHAHCPVIVVRDTDTGDGPNAGRVVIGVDGSVLSQAAVRFGLREARLRRLPVTVLHAWHYPTTTRDGYFVLGVGDREAMENRATAVLSDSLAGIRREYADVEVTRTSLHGNTRQILLEQSRGAQLLVVGSRGHGGFAGLVLGSTSQAMLHHAHAPVAIVHAADEATP